MDRTLCIPVEFYGPGILASTMNHGTSDQIVEMFLSIDTAQDREVRGFDSNRRAWPYRLRSEHLARLEPPTGGIGRGQGDEPAVGIDQHDPARREAEIGEIRGAEPPSGGHGGHLGGIE